MLVAHKDVPAELQEEEIGVGVHFPVGGCRSIEEWVERYIESGVAAQEWEEQHHDAMTFLYALTQGA